MDAERAWVLSDDAAATTRPLTESEYSAIRAAFDGRNYAKALALLQSARVARSGRADADALVIEATVFERLGRLDEAEHCAAEAADRDPTAYSAWELLGIIHMRREAWELAAGALRGATAAMLTTAFRAAEIEVPDFPPRADAPEHPFLSATHIVIPRDLVDALRQLGDYSRIMDFLGACYARLGRVDDARRAWADAVRFAPEGRSPPVAAAGLRQLDEAGLTGQR